MISRKIIRVLWPAICVLVLFGFSVSVAAAQQPDPKALLKRMSDEISALQAYSISGDGYTDARLEAGLIVEHATQATMWVQKPDKVRITNRTSEDVKELFFADNLLTVYTQSNNLYARTEVPDGTGAALTYAVDELGIDVPMMDFVSGNVAERLLANSTEVMHLGLSLIRGKEFEHVVIRTSEVDVQLWIAAKGKPLPGKMSLSAKWDGGAPRTVVFMDWNTAPEIPKGSLSFVPPEGAMQIYFETQLDSEEK